MTSKRWFQLVSSLVLSAGFIWYAVRGVDFSAVGRLLRDAEYRWVLPALVLLGAIQLIRVWRFGYLVAPLAKVPFRSLFHINNIGMLAVFALPIRLGEFVRPFLLKRDYGSKLSAGLGSSAAERVVDGLVVTLGFFVVTRAGLEVPEAMQHAGLLALLAFVGAAVVLALVLVGHEHGVEILRRVVNVVSPGLANRLVSIVVSFADGLRALTNLRSAGIYVVWTVSFWFLSGLCNYVLFRVMHIELPLIAGYVILALTVIAVMVPSGPGFIGPLQAAVVWGLSLFAIDRDTAFAYSLFVHASSAFVTIAFGVFSLIASHVSMTDVVKASNQEATELA